MKALVTGGGGFLGLYIVEQLLQRNDDVRVFCRGHHPLLEKLGVEIARGDIRDKSAVMNACRGCDVVFHVAAIPGIWGSWQEYHSINTLGTENVIEGCRQNGVSKLIYTSSPSVVFSGNEHLDADESLPYPDRFLCHYSHSKALAEQSVLGANGEKNFASCALRPHLIWGPRDHHLIPKLIARAKAGKLMRVGDGQNLVSISYVENVASAHLQVAEVLLQESRVAGKVYFINEPEPVNLWNWIDEILQLAGLSQVSKNISATTAYKVGALMEMFSKLFLIKSEPRMTRFLALQLSKSHTYSVKAAERDFYRPKYSFEEGMQRLAMELRTS